MRDYFPPKSLNYAAFVEELGELHDEAIAIESVGVWNPRHVAFRRWKARLFDLLARIRKACYEDIRCDVEDRDFNYDGPEGDHGVHARKVFDDAMEDTLIELKLIIDNFNKYGDPSPIKPETESGSSGVAAPAHEPLPVPEKVTIPWLWKNVSVPLMVGGIVFVGAVFTVGLGLGGTKAGQTLIGFFSPASAPVVPPTPASAVAIAPVSPAPGTTKKVTTPGEAAVGTAAAPSGIPTTGTIFETHAETGSTAIGQYNGTFNFGVQPAAPASSGSATR